MKTKTTSKKPLLNKILNWILNKTPKVKKQLLIDFINETNGSQILTVDYYGGQGETVSIETRGLLLQDLKIMKPK